MYTVYSLLALLLFKFYKHLLLFAFCTCTVACRSVNASLLAALPLCLLYFAALSPLLFSACCASTVSSLLAALSSLHFSLCFQCVFSTCSSVIASLLCLCHRFSSRRASTVSSLLAALSSLLFSACCVSTVSSLLAALS